MFDFRNANDMKKYPVFLVFLMLGFYVSAQQEFTPIKAQGKVPSEILILASEAYQLDIEKASVEEGIENDDLERFYKEINFQVSSLLKSGSILWGDPLSEYVNSVGQSVLEASGYEGEMRFYLVKDDAVNAFTTQKGLVFVNMGLLAYVENEAQLAFVLAHELVHYFERHAIEGFKEQKRLENKKGALRKMSYGARKNIYIDYSKSLELESDRKGFDIFIKMGYHPYEALNVLDLLVGSEYAYFSGPVDSLCFDDAYYHLPAKYRKPQILPLGITDNEDDSLHFHPNVFKRKQQIYSLIEEKQLDSVGKQFLSSSSRFAELQRLARYDVCKMALDYLDFGKALYLSTKLLEQNENDTYLMYVQSYALYALSKYRNHFSGLKSLPFTIFITDYGYGGYSPLDGTQLEIGFLRENDYKGDTGPLYQLLDTLSDKELNILAIRQIMHALELQKENEFLLKLARNSIYDLLFYHDVNLSFFQLGAPMNMGFIEKTNEELAELEASEVRMYNVMKGMYSRDIGILYQRYAFLEIMQDSFFYDLFKGVEDEFYGLGLPTRDNEDDFYALMKNGGRKIKAYKQKAIDTVVSVDPVCMVIRNGDFEYDRTEFRETNFIQLMQADAGQVGLNLEVLDAYSFDSTDAQGFADIYFFKNYIHEMEQQQSAARGLNMVLANEYYIPELVNRYQTPYFMQNAFFSTVQPRKKRIPTLLLTMVAYPTLPFGLYYTFTKDVDFHYVCVMVDVEANELVFLTYRVLPSRDYNHIIESVIYNEVYQMKHYQQKGGKS
jgi:hypothetical protein